MVIMCHHAASKSINARVKRRRLALYVTFNCLKMIWVCLWLLMTVTRHWRLKGRICWVLWLTAENAAGWGLCQFTLRAWNFSRQLNKTPPISSEWNINIWSAHQIVSDIHLVGNVWTLDWIEKLKALWDTKLNQTLDGDGMEKRGKEKTTQAPVFFPLHLSVRNNDILFHKLE